MYIKFRSEVRYSLTLLSKDRFIEAGTEVVYITIPDDYIV